MNTNITMRYVIENEEGEEELVLEPLKEQLRMFTGIVDTYVDIRNYPKFLKYYVGVEQEIVTISDENQLKELEIENIVENLSNYPNDDSIFITDDVVIVKFSDIDNE